MHRRQIKRAMILVGAAAASLALAACSSGATTQPVTTGKSNSAVSTSGGGPTPEDAGKIVAVTTGDAPPLSVKKGGSITGATPALVDAIAKKLNIKVDWIIAPFAGVIPAVTSGRAQLVADAVFITPDRAKQVLFSTPIYGWSDGLIVKSSDNNNYTSPSQLAGKTVGVLASSTQYGIMSKVKGATAKSYQSYQTMWLDLRAGRLDAALVDPPNINYLMKKEPSTKVKYDTAFNGGQVNWVGLAVAKSNTKLMDSINTVIKGMIKDGSLKTIVSRYTGTSGIKFPS